MPCIFIAIALNLKIILKSINNINSSNLWTEGIFPFVCVWVCAFPVCWSLTFWVKFTLKCYFLNFSLLLKDTKVRHGHKHTHTLANTHMPTCTHPTNTRIHMYSHTHACIYTCMLAWLILHERNYMTFSPLLLHPSLKPSPPMEKTAPEWLSCLLRCI